MCARMPTCPPERTLHPSQRNRTLFIYAVCGLLLIITLLTLPRLNDSLWTDEQRTLWYAGAPPLYGPVSVATSLERIAENQWQSPGYFIAVKGWGYALGWDALPMRLFSLYAGLLAAAVTYRVGRLLFNAEVGFYAAFTFGVSAFTVHYLHDMRTYTLNALLTALMLWAYWELHTRRRGWGWYPLLVVSVAGLLYTHYFNVFAVAALGLYHLIFRFRQRHYWAVIVCFTVAGAMFLPWFEVLLQGAQRSTVDKRALGNMPPLDMLNMALNMFSNEARALTIVLLAFSIRPMTRERRFVWFWLVVAVSSTLIVTRFFPALTEIKYVIFLWPGLALAAGVGIARLKQFRVAVPLVLTLWGGLALWNLTHPAAQARIQSPDWFLPLAPLADALQGRTRDTDALLFHVADGVGEIDHNDLIDYYTHGMSLYRSDLVLATNATPDQLYYDRVREYIEYTPRVWIAYEPGRRHWRVGPVQTILLPEVGYAQCAVVEQTDDIYLALFSARPRLATAYEFFTPEGGEIDLYLITEPHRTADGRLEVNAGWEVLEEVPPDLYSMAIHIEDEAGNFIAGVDNGMPGHQFGCAYNQIPLPDLPLGTYLVRFTVYNWQTGGRIRSEAPAADGERPIVTTFDMP